MANRRLSLSITVPNTASVTTVGTATPGFGKYISLKGEASFVGVTGGTLDLYIQHSFDNGVTWYDCAHFAQLAGGAAAVSLDFQPPLADGTIRTVGTGTASTATPALTVNTIAPGPWGDLLRLVSITGVGVTVGAVESISLLAWDGSESGA